MNPITQAVVDAAVEYIQVRERLLTGPMDVPRHLVQEVEREASNAVEALRAAVDTYNATVKPDGLITDMVCKAHGVKGCLPCQGIFETPNEQEAIDIALYGPKVKS